MSNEQLLKKITTLLSTELARNTMTKYATALAIIIIGMTIVWLTKSFILRRLKNWLAAPDVTAAVDTRLAYATLSSLIPMFYLIPLSMGVNSLAFSPTWRQSIHFLLLLLFTTRFIRFLSNLAALVTDFYLRKKHKGSLESASGKVIMPIIRVIFWALGATFLLDALGFQVSSIVAGLGIAGVAVGLAAQAVLGDFFGYLAIVLDQPFTIGDFISFGDTSGTVESIGLKTTRLRTTSGELLVCPNSDLTKQRLANFRALKKRSRSFTFGIVYETPLEKVRAIPDMVREISAGLEGLDVNRVNFTKLADSSLDYEVMFTVPSEAYAELLNMQQTLLLAIMERFAREGISFAYPTRTLYMSTAETGLPSSV